MMRSLLNQAVARTLPLLPRQLVWQFSQRYIAGESLAEALSVVDQLNRSGASATLDVLGEDTTERSQVMACRNLYLEALALIAEQRLDCNISIKLSEMGLRFDPQLCRTVMRELVEAAEGNFIRIDMEDSTLTDRTLDVYRELRRDFSNVGIVLQARLHRTPQDIEELLAEEIAHVRLCKGIYLEPPAIAHQRPQQIDQAFRELLDQLIDGEAEKVGIATHDPELVDFALDRIRESAVPEQRYEFQMLLGVAESLRQDLIADAHPLRVYVPFGEHWYAYSVRRLRENPSIAGHVIGNLFS